MSAGKSATLQVRVTPRAGRTAIDGWRGDVLVIRLAAAPVGGAANEALTELLAQVLQVPRRNVAIAAGERGRSKRVRIADLSAAQLADRLAATARRTENGDTQLFAKPDRSP
jgi:uncharacterized protein